MLVSGTSEAMGRAVWFGSNVKEQEWAVPYVEQDRQIWEETPDALAFLRWIETEPAFAAERAAVFATYERLLWEEPGPVRSATIDECQRLRAAVDDSLSETMAIQRPLSRDGVTVWQNNELAGGQDVWHLHTHMIPAVHR